tara:strand:+ start:640 stop:1419 length:780 start_codon:yes stop_codon:yes gene_type:complete
MPKIEITNTKGLVQKTGTGFDFYGVDLVPNDISTTMLGLNPTWRLNFGGATLAAGSNTTDLHLIDKLTPVNTLFKLSQALEKVAAQGTVITAAQAGQIFGATSNAGTIKDMTGVTAVTTNLIPATLTPITVTGTTAADLLMNDSATNLNTDLDQSIIVFNSYVIEAGHAVTIAMHADNEHLRASTEFVCSGAGTDVMTRQGQGTDEHRDIILTASGVDTTILPGSYIYLQAGADADELAIKGCIRTTGGTIAVTYANNN